MGMIWGPLARQKPSQNLTLSALPSWADRGEQTTTSCPPSQAQYGCYSSPLFSRQFSPRETGNKSLGPLWRPAFNPLAGPAAEQGALRARRPRRITGTLLCVYLHSCKPQGPMSSPCFPSSLSFLHFARGANYSHQGT